MRRRVAGAGTALVAAVLLALRWYDDGSVRRAGLLVLAPIQDRPDDVPGLGWVRLAAALTVLAALAALALATSRPRPDPDWAARPIHPDPDPSPADGATDTAGPAGPAGTGGTGEGGVRGAEMWWVVGSAGVAAVAAAVGAWRLGGPATAAVPAAAVVLAGCAAGVLLVSRGRGKAALATGIALAVVVALGATLGAPWFADGRHVRRTETGAAAPADPDAGPARPGRVGWTRDVRRAYAGGGYAVVAEDVGGAGLRVAVLDAATGRERWAYRHTDAFVDARIDPADGVLVLRRDRDGAYRLLAFDLASGRPLWTMSTEAEPLDDSAGFDEDAQLLSPGVLLLREKESITALDPRTGARRWSRDGLACLGGTGVARAGDVVVLTGLCRTRTVVAVRAATGETAWESEVSGTPGYTGAPGRPPLVVAGTMVLTLVGPRESDPQRLVAVDTGTGRVRWSSDWRPGVLPAVVVGGRVVAVEYGRGTLTAVARDPATGRVAWRTGLGAAGGEGVDQVAGSDGERLYLLSDPYTGAVRVDVLDPDGRMAGTGSLPGCVNRVCTGTRVSLTGATTLVASGGALVVLSAGIRPVAAITDGPAYRVR